jgi:hypothetical protein
MRLMGLIYTSRPFGFDAATLDDILLSARRNNARDGITGALICRADLYAQWLEGEREAVTMTFRRIQADDRHVDVRLAWAGDLDARHFPDWSMRDDPPRSWMWSQAEVRAGAVRDAPEQSLREVFSRLAAELQSEAQA